MTSHHMAWRACDFLKSVRHEFVGHFFLSKASVYAVKTLTEVVIPSITFFNSNSSKYPA